MPKAYRKGKSKAERREDLSSFILGFDRIEMPACSTCRRAGEVCHVLTAHPDYARCLKLGNRCDASFDSKQGELRPSCCLGRSY